MSHTEQDLRERRLIEDMLHTKIAAEIGRHRSTVYREIKLSPLSTKRSTHTFMVPKANRRSWRGIFLTAVGSGGHAMRDDPEV